MLRNPSVRAIAVIGATLFVSAATQASLVSWWQFENNLHDSAGSNNGTANGSIGYGPGAVGQGLVLSGSGWVDVSNPVSGGLQTLTGFTIAAWMRRDQDSTGSSTGSIMNLRTAANNSGFTLEQTFGQPTSMSFGVNTSGTTTFDTVTVAGWQQGQLYHVAASFDATNHLLKIYQNGALVGSHATGGTNMTADANSLFRMGDNIVNDSRWVGLIDEGRFYNSVLTDQQVAALVPEPISLFGFGVGLAVLVGRRRRQKAVV